MCSLRDHFGIILWSFWCHFYHILRPFCAVFGPRLRSFRDSFGDVSVRRMQLSKRMQDKGKICQNYETLNKNTPFIAYKSLVLRKKGQDRRFNLRKWGTYTLCYYRLYLSIGYFKVLWARSRSCRSCCR